MGAEAGGLGPLTALPGVGPARASQLAGLGLRSIRDLLLLAPRRLELGGPRATVAQALAAVGRDATVAGRVRRLRLSRFGRRRSLVRAELADETGAIEVRFFQQPWIFERLRAGQEIEVSGRVVERGPALVARRLGSPGRPLDGAPVPVYPTAQGVGQPFLRRLARRAAADHAARLPEPLGPELLARLDLPPLPEAVRELHEPRSAEAFARARTRVGFEAALALQARVLARRAAARSGRAPAIATATGARDEAALRALLPFDLTCDQTRAWDELRADLARGVPTRRLLQGEVGSGKTAVAFLAAVAVARAGGQTAFLAPTEVLAEQHRAGLRGWCERAGLGAALLTGSTPPAERRAVLAGLAAGDVQLLFGTHALFSADVAYRSLALAVIDEQHRFGVAQRQHLLDKGGDGGRGVHALLMTATPIPRTLALTVYGDLDTSVLRERPPGRGPITTRWLRGNERRRLRAALRARLEAGERAFWVCPRIGEDGESDEPSTALARHAALARTELAAFGLELVHGRLPADERTARLDRFRRGEARLCVATTVIEVGVDVPEATAMVVEDAERLGLAQLHQLRGRVGRGPRPSAFWILGDAGAAERFELLERTSDGFEIAEQDLLWRGMGELAGLRQAGASAEGWEDLPVELLLEARDLMARDASLRASYAVEPDGELTP